MIRTPRFAISQQGAKSPVPLQIANLQLHAPILFPSVTIMCCRLECEPALSV